MSLDLPWKIYVFNGNTNFIFEPHCFYAYCTREDEIIKIDPILSPMAYIKDDFTLTIPKNLNIKDILKYMKDNRIHARHIISTGI